MHLLNLPTVRSGYCVVRRGKLSGVGWHYGFLTDSGQVFEASASHPGHLVPSHEFAQSQSVERERPLTPLEISGALERLQQALDDQLPYNFASNNCEQVVRWIAYGTPHCTQFAALAVGIPVATVIADSGRPSTRG